MHSQSYLQLVGILASIYISAFAQNLCTVPDFVELINGFVSIPSVGIDSAISLVASKWSSSGYSAQTLCSQLQSAYGVVPGVSNGTMSDRIYSIWSSPQLVCDYVIGTNRSIPCADFVKTYNAQPFVNWRTMLDQIQSLWTSQCVQSTCDAWRSQYGVVGGVTWGNLPTQLRYSWGAMECDYRTGPYSQPTCLNALQRYNATPFVDWGSMPDSVQSLWNTQTCYSAICRTWRSQYGVTPRRNWGRLPGNYQYAWARMACDNP